MERKQLLNSLVSIILAIERPHPVRVAIDGVDCSGKTTLADELAEIVRASGRLVIRATIDGFHNPREVRYSRGADSPEGYYFDSFDYDAVKNLLLIPLGPGGSLKFQTGKFDFRTDSKVETPELTASPDSILLFDGVFLLREELIDLWDYTIFVDVTFDTVLKRAVERDAGLLGGEQSVIDRYKKRYIPGQMVYLGSVNPAVKADTVVINNDFMDPELR